MTIPRLRQIVLITDDLPTALDEARSIFGFTDSVADEPGMTALGYQHEVFSFQETFVEIMAPLDNSTPMGQSLAKTGPWGYMAVVQVDDIEGIRERAAAKGHTPVLEQIYGGHPLTQWHPKVFGTLAELDEIPEESWHFGEAIFANATTTVATDIVGITLAVPDPEATAATWGELVQIPVDGTTVKFAGEQIHCIPATDGKRGVIGVDVLATDPARVGEKVTLCGVTFTFVADRVGN